MTGPDAWRDVPILRPGWYLFRVTVYSAGTRISWSEPNFERISAGQDVQEVGLAAGGEQVHTSKIGTSTIHRGIDLFSFVTDPAGSGSGHEMVLLRAADFRVVRIVLAPLDETRARTGFLPAETCSLYSIGARS